MLAWFIVVKCKHGMCSQCARAVVRVAKLRLHFQARHTQIQKDKLTTF